MNSNSEIQGYNVYPMLHFHRKFSSGITACLANEAFQSVSYSAPSILPKTISAQPSPLSMARLSPVSPLLVTPKSPLPTLSMGILMDVNTTRKARSLPP